MPQTFDLVLANGTVVNQDGAFPRDVGVRDGRIAGIGDLSAASAGERIDCKGLHVLPGVIDSQVHFREPGPVHKEDLETGSRAAVLGGVTAVFEMPNTDPTTTTAEALADKMRRAKGRMHCDFAFWVGGHARQRRRHSRARTAAGRGGNQGVHGLFDRAAAGRRRRRRARDPEADPPPRRLPQRGRSAPQRKEAAARRGRSVVASGLARRDRRPALDRAPRAARARGARAGARAARLDPRGDGIPGRGEGRRDLRGDAASPDAERRRLSAPRDEAADEPAGARRRSIARRSGAGSSRASSTCSAPITRPTRSRRKRSPIPTAPRA